MAFSSETRPAVRGFLPPRDDDERLVMRRAQDLLRAAQSRGRVSCSAFLCDREQTLTAAALNREGCDFYSFDGGFAQAERKVLCIRPAGALGEPPFCCIRVRCDSPGAEHRDFLGALLGLSIERASLGDILLEQGARRTVAYVAALRAVSQLVVDELRSVGRFGAEAEFYDFSKVPAEVAAPERALKTVTIPSLRLDAVLAAMLNCSRTAAVDLIRAGRVEIGHIAVIAPHEELYEGDVLTVRGKGRFKLAALGGRSRKNRLFIQYFQY